MLLLSHFLLLLIRLLNLSLSVSQNLQGKFCLLTTDVATYLGEGLRGIGSKFLRSSQMLTTCSDCPTIYIDADTVSAAGKLLPTISWVWTLIF